jgi:hypothetical protein
MKEERYLIDFLTKLEMAYKQALKISKDIIYKAELEEKYDFYGYHTKK